MAQKRKTDRAYRWYTPEDLIAIRTLADDGKSITQIAERIGRTVGSIAGMLGRHGIHAHHSRGGQPCHKPK